MQPWLLLGILSYLSYAISTSIDKYMMNKKYNTVKTLTLKSFFDGVILLIIGFVFFNLKFDSSLILTSSILGAIFAFAGIIYFVSLKLKDVTLVIPYYQSLTILLIFISSIIIFNESVNVFDYIGITLILLGVYSVLSDNGLKFPKLDKAIFLILLLIIIDVVYSLLAKKFLFDVNPINLGITMYFSATIILVIFLIIQQLFKKQPITDLIKINTKTYKVFIAAFFGAIGTLLLFSALSVGDASKVFPIAGLQSVFIFIIALLFLKEKFYWHRLIGIVVVFFGIFFISL